MKHRHSPKGLWVNGAGTLVMSCACGVSWEYVEPKAPEPQPIVAAVSHRGSLITTDGVRILRHDGKDAIDITPYFV